MDTLSALKVLLKSDLVLTRLVSLILSASIVKTYCTATDIPLKIGGAMTQIWKWRIHPYFDACQQKENVTRTGSTEGTDVLLKNSIWIFDTQRVWAFIGKSVLAFLPQHLGASEKSAWSAFFDFTAMTWQSGTIFLLHAENILCF